MREITSKNLIGEKFGKLTVIKFVEITKGERRLWKCKCECNTEIDVVETKLTSGYYVCCGCTQEIPYGSKTKNLKGKRFGKLTVLRYAGVKKRVAWWVCVCDCELKTEKEVRASSLLRGTSMSCGCMSKLGHKLVHGYNKTTEYRIWLQIKGRCYCKSNKQYKDYGGRGIKMSDDWKNSFESFLVDMGKRPSANLSIDRIDNDGDYCFENCRWATNEEQANNRRSSKKIFFNGKNLTLRQWAIELCKDYDKMAIKIDNGWTPEDVLLCPDNMNKREYLQLMDKNDE